jgi:drug/metabolite transporter (DMT)-like permease
VNWLADQAHISDLHTSLVTPPSTPSFSFRPYLVLGIGIVLLGFSGIFVRWANAPGAVTGFYRMLVAIVVLAWPFRQRIRLQGPIPRTELWIALAGGLFFAGDLVFWNTGVLISGATNPTLMGNTAPLWVGLGALLFFHEQLGLAFWLGLLIAMTGAFIVLGYDALQDLSLGLGTFFGLLAGIFYGGYFLITQRGRQKLDALSYFWISALGSAVVLLLIAILLRQPLTGYSSTTYANFLALGLLVQVGGQYAFSYALGFLPASIVSPAGLGQPVVTAILAVPLLGEVLSFWQIIGGLAVLGGVYIVHRSRQP